MAKYKTEDIRNVVFCGHVSAGKTTLVDRILNDTGAVHRQASVDDGTSICDFDEEEKTHKYTIETKVTHFDYKTQVVSTFWIRPGIRTSWARRSARCAAVDTAAIIVNAQAGIQVNTRRVFAEAEKAGVWAEFIVVNKMDSDNIDFSALMETIKETFGAACVPLNVPPRSRRRFQGRGKYPQRSLRHRGRAGRPERNQRTAAGVDHRGRRGGDGAVLRRGGLRATKNSRD